MTTQLQTRLATLRVLLNEIVENAEKATPGKWGATSWPERGRVFIWVGQQELFSTDSQSWRQHGTFEDATFIAQSRTTSPQMARVIIGELDFLERQSMSETCADEAHGCNHPQDASERLESIFKEFGL